MSSNYGHKSLLVAVKSVKGHICFAKPFLLKMGCEISGWRFLKFWYFYAGFYCRQNLRDLGKTRNWTLWHCHSHTNIKILQPNIKGATANVYSRSGRDSAFLILTVVET